MLSSLDLTEIEIVGDVFFCVVRMDGMGYFNTNIFPKHVLFSSTPTNGDING